MITGNLEYLMSSLPHLSFQNTDEERSRVVDLLRKYAGPSEEHHSIIAILDREASKFLGPKGSKLLQQISLAGIHEEVFQRSKHRVLASFATYAYTLKNDIYRLRISRSKGTNVATAKKQELPLVPGNPLEEEIQLLKWQWNKLDELSIGHYADFGALALYKLKLLLLLRWWGFDQKKGFDNFLNITT